MNRIYYILPILFFCSFTISVKGQNDLTKKIEENTRLEKSIEALVKDSARLSQNIAQLRSNMSNDSLMLNRLKGELFELQAAVDKKAIAKLEKEIDKRLDEIKELKKKFGNLEVLKGIDLEVNSGEIAVIVGPSGGGKTTLLRCVNGLEFCDEGTIEIDNKYLCKDGVYCEKKEFNQARREIGLVFQNFNLFPHMSVLENLIEAPKRVLGINEEEQPKKEVPVETTEYFDPSKARKKETLENSHFEEPEIITDYSQLREILQRDFISPEQ